MSENKAVILMTSGPDEPRRCASPFFLATIGAVMDYDQVAMVFTTDGSLLLKKGIAETVFPKPGGKSVAAFLKDAVDAGVQLYACTPSLELHNMTESDLIDGVKIIGGAALWEMAEQAKIAFSF
ncbi:MAG: DsrE family protein [Chloroflexi bacterium]|nr:DsrE family protein [Chloroflexota bacterium]